MSNRQTGITAATAETIIFGAGALYSGFTSMAVPGTLLGATKGGSSFTLPTEILDLGGDGAPGKIMNHQHIINVEMKLTVNLFEQTIANFLKLVPGASTTTYEVLWNDLTRLRNLQESDYIDNIVLLAEVSGNVSAFGIKLDNVLSTNSIEIGTQDKDSTVIPVTFEAHFDPADLDTEPWQLMMPIPVV